MKTKGTPLFYLSKRIPAQFEYLKDVGEYIHQACQAAGFDAAVDYSMQLAVDEAFSNIIEHAYHNPQGINAIDFICAVDAFALYVELHDQGTPFNPTEIPNPDFSTDIVQRTRGGLGLYFMHRLMDEVQFLFISEREPPDSRPPGNFLLMIKYRSQNHE